MKRIVICMDGTWQALNMETLTNIGIIARSVAHRAKWTDETGAEHEIPQIVIYTHGVGATTGEIIRRSVLGRLSAKLNRLAGGAFGEGLDDGILDTYLRLVFAYEPGDEIYIIGFSRGAFAARRLAGLICCAGILSRRFAEKAYLAFSLYQDRPKAKATEEAKAAHEAKERQFRSLFGKRARGAPREAAAEAPKIAYLGVFDTVIQFGAADVCRSVLPWGYKWNEFPNLRICPNVLSARHAVAIDENRFAFPATLWEGLDEANARARARDGAGSKGAAYEQKWFVGTHSDVGGGEQSRLANLPLKWIAEGAAQAGLEFYQTEDQQVSPLAEALRESNLTHDAPITRPVIWKGLGPLHWPTQTRRIWERRETPAAADARERLNPGVWRRVNAAQLEPRYRPRPLRPFRSVLTELRDEEG